MKRILGVIVGRAGSKRLPGKHLLPLGGRPLLVWTLAAAKGASALTRLIISTDSREMAALAGKHGVEVPFMRPDGLAGDAARPVDVLRHALDFLERRGDGYDAVVLLQPTSPFRTSAHIDEALAVYRSTDADTVTSVCNVKEHAYYQATVTDGRFLTPLCPRGYGMPRHELPDAVIENGEIYVCSGADIRVGRFYGERVLAYSMRREDSVDIDTGDDLLWAEWLAQHREQETIHLEEVDDECPDDSI